MPEKFDTYAPGRRYELGAPLLNRILRAIERLSNFSVSAPLRLQDTGAGRILSLSIPLPRDLIVHVALTKDGGADGTAPATPATWTYTAKDSTGKTLGATLSPLAPRELCCATTVATDGIGYFRAGTTFVLLKAHESYSGVVCDDGSSGD